MAIKQITSAPSISPEGKSIAKIREIRGNSLVWNQLCSFTYGNQTSTSNGITVTAINNYSFKLSGTATANVSFTNYLRHNFEQADHKYYVNNHFPTGVSVTANGYSSTFNFNKNGGITTGSVTGKTQYYYLKITSGTDFGTDGIIINPIVIDLTLMFGSGSEPDTVEEFEAMFPENYYEYNSGEIINSNINAIETVGFNQWDEEVEEGLINTATGQNQSSSGRWRSKNYIPVFPASAYYFCNTMASASNVIYLFAYDANKNYIGCYGGSTWGNANPAPFNNVIVNLPTNCYFIRIQNYSGATYQNTICINLSDASRNGIYEPYKKSTLPLNISTLTGKLNGEGESVKIFPYGLRGIGEVYDSLIIDPDGFARRAVKVMESVDLGTLDWGKRTKNDDEYVYFFSNYFSSGKDRTTAFYGLCDKGYSYSNSYATGADKSIVIRSGNSSTSGNAICIRDLSYQDSTPEEFRAAMAGVKLIYELATPQTYVLDTPILMEYSTDGGTEQIVFSENLLSTPLVADVDYFSNAIKHIQFSDETHCIRDERITGIDYIPIEQSTNVITSAGVYNAISEAKAPLQSVSYKSAWLSSSTHTVHFLMNVKPIDWEKVYTVKYRLNCSIENTTSSNTESLVTLQFTKDSLRAYYVENAVTSTSYKSFYQHYVYPVSDVGFNSGFGSGVGIYIHQSTASYSYAGSSRYRLIDVDLLEAINCEVELFSEDLDAEDMQLDTSTTHGAGVAISSATGLQETSDANTTYANYSFGNSYGICTTVEETLAKTSAISNYNLTTGAITTIYFENAVPADSTLNVNAEGAKPIYYKNEPITDNIIKAGDTATFRYTSAVLSSGAYMLVALDRDFNDFVVENKSASLAAAGSSATIATVNGTNITVTTPSSWIVTDTKNTAGSTDTSSKIFLIGATSQDTNPQTYSDNEVYVTSGVLTTKSVQVGGTSATIQYNSTDQSIEFVFS